jgi:hypothetical protein
MIGHFKQRDTRRPWRMKSAPNLRHRGLPSRVADEFVPIPEHIDSIEICSVHRAIFGTLFPGEMETPSEY